MPFDSFNCGTGTEVLYPHNIMNSHFSEPEWTSSNPVCAALRTKLTIKRVSIHGEIIGASWTR